MLAGGLHERTSGAAGQPLAGGYQRRIPERTVLHELVSRHAPTLLAELRDATSAADRAERCRLPLCRGAHRAAARSASATARRR